MSTEEDSHHGDASSPATASASASASAKEESPVVGLLIFGGMLVVAGIIAGLALALHVEPAGCDESFQSCSHPHEAFGLTLIGASLFAAILLALVGVVARRVVVSLPRRLD